MFIHVHTHNLVEGLQDYAHVKIYCRTAIVHMNGYKIKRERCVYTSMYMDHMIWKCLDTVTHTYTHQLVVSVAAVVMESAEGVVGTVMDDTLLMGGREMGRGAVISESGV